MPNCVRHASSQRRKPPSGSGGVGGEGDESGAGGAEGDGQCAAPEVRCQTAPLVQTIVHLPAVIPIVTPGGCRVPLTAVPEKVI